MKRQLKITIASVIFSVLGLTQVAQANPSEIYCTIRESGGTLSCQWLGKDMRKSMSAEDISKFVDDAQVAAYITLKSRKGMERTYFIDGQAQQYKRLADVKKTASMSEIAKAKSDLFNEIEKKIIKLSDELDGQAAAAELVKYDSSITNDKFKREFRSMNAELDGYRKNRDKVCTSTPAFEQMSKANASLQQTLSNILYAFQTPDSCMSDFKVFKDKDGSVDLRQLDGLAQKFQAQCKRK
jgi:hypothetical protein